MTKVEIYNNKNELRMCISGHAGYGELNNLPSGCDIVCSAISIISYTVMQRVTDMENEGKTISTEIDYKPGYVSIFVTVQDNFRKELSWTVETIKTAYKLLSDTYPDFITLCFGVGER